MAVNDPIQETTLSEKRATQNPTPLHTENKTAKEVEALEAALIVAELEKETVKTALQALHTEYEELLLVLKYLNTEYSSLLASFKSLNEEHTLLKQAHFSQQEAMLKKEINVLQDRLSVMMPSFQLGRSATAEAAVQSVTAVVNTITPQQWNQGVYIFFEKDVSRLFFQTFGATLQSEEKRLKVACTINRQDIGR